MAQLAFGLIGAAVAGPLGVSVATGWIVGSLVGTLLFPPGGGAEGPRLTDLTGLQSSYGGIIPKTYGTMRMSGNVIWSKIITELGTTRKVGGAFGIGGSKVTTYTYFRSFAVAFGEGIACDIVRIWADGKLIFDKSGSADDIIKQGVKFRFYTGNETQEPDSLIESTEGVDATPAFRGLAYIVFEELPLLDFSNHTPDISAEVNFNITVPDPARLTETSDFFTVAEGGLTDNFEIDQVYPDYQRGGIIIGVRSGTVGQNFIRHLQTRTMIEDKQTAYILDASGNNVDFLEIQTVMPDGGIIFTGSVSNGRPLSLVNPDSLEIVDTFGVDTGFGGFSSTQFPALKLGVCTFCSIQGSSNAEQYFIGVRVTGAAEFGVLRVRSASLDFVGAAGVIGSTIVSSGTGAKGVGFGEAYIISATSNTNHLFKINIRGGASFSPIVGVTSGIRTDLIRTFQATDLLAGATTIDRLTGIVYDETDDNIIFEFRADGVNHVTKINTSTGVQIWVTATGIPAKIDVAGFNTSRIIDGQYSRVEDTTSITVDVATGELLKTRTGWPVAATGSSSGWWDGKSGTYFGVSGGNIHKFFLNRTIKQSLTLADVVKDLSLRAGLSEDDIDVTSLSGKEVPGYTINRLTSIRASIQLLAQIFLFDGVESDFKLKFILRDGKSVTATLDQDDLMNLRSNTGEVFRETRTQEVELPRRFTLTFLDIDKDYLISTQSAQRILSPVAGSNSNNDISLQVAMSFTSDLGKQIAEIQLYTAWFERSSFSIKLPLKFMTIDPADIISVTLNDGTVFRGRVIQSDIGVDLSVEIEAVIEDAVQYTSTVIADSGTGVPTQEFLSTPDTRLIMLCSPLLSDADDVVRTNSQIYFLMGGFGQPGWLAGSLFSSPDNIEFIEIGASIEEMAHGTLSNVLGDVTCPFSTDEINTIKVFMTLEDTQLVSVSQLEMVNGSNLAAIIHGDGIDVEIIQFRDVTQNADNSFTLSGLLRGRRGSEVFTSNHAIGDTFVLLGTTAVGRTLISISEINQSRFYRAITSGLLFEDADTISKSSPGNDLKPYAPVSQRAAPSGNDIDFTWERRTRVGGGLQDGVGEVPVSEDTEEYELEVLDNPGGSVVRTFLALTTTAVTYTSAQQTTDGFTPPLNQITIKIYQISAQVGRGFTKEVTLDVE